MGGTGFADIDSKYRSCGAKAQNQEMGAGTSVVGKVQLLRPPRFVPDDGRWSLPG